MKKLEKEQLPKVIAMGVIATGAFGYAAYSLCAGKGAPAPAAAAAPHPTNPVQRAGADSSTAISVMQFPPIENSDPFRPAYVPQGPGSRPAPKPAAPAAKPGKPNQAPKLKPGPQMLARLPLADDFNGPALDGVPGVLTAIPPVGRTGGHPDGTAKPSPAPGGAAAAPPAAAASQPKPAAAAREVVTPAPAVTVTGILEGDQSVAILKWSDSHRQVVRVGDHLDGGYTIKEIRTDAVVLGHGSHQWTVRIGDGSSS